MHHPSNDLILMLASRKTMFRYIVRTVREAGRTGSQRDPDLSMERVGVKRGGLLREGRQFSSAGDLHLYRLD